MKLKSKSKSKLVHNVNIIKNNKSLTLINAWSLQVPLTIKIHLNTKDLYMPNMHWSIERQFTVN